MDQPLMTNVLRQQQKEARMQKYPRVIIRVHFPERIMLQGVFNVRESGKYGEEDNCKLTWRCFAAPVIDMNK